MRRYVQFLLRYPRAVVAGAAVISLIFSIAIPRVNVYVDPEANLPSEHPYVETNHRIADLFGGRKIVSVAIVPHNGTIWTPEGLALIADMTEQAYDLPEVDPPGVLSIAADRAKDIRGTAEGLEVQLLMPEVPQTPQEIAALREALGRNPVYQNALIAADGSAAALHLDFYAEARDVEIYERVRNLLDQFEHRGADLYLTGLPVFAHHFTVATRQVLRSFVVAVVVVAVILLWAFRTLQGMILPLMTGLMSVGWATGAMGILGVHLDAWNAMTPILVLAVASGHATQVLKRYYEEYERLGDSQAAVLEATTRVGVVMLIAGLIATLSFASLAIFGIPSVTMFGLYTAFGISSALILELTFVPACRALLPRPRKRRRGVGTTRLLLAAAARVLVRPAGRTVVLAAALCVIAVAIAGTIRVVADNSFRLYFPPSNEARVGAEVIERDFGGASPVAVYLEGNEPEALTEPAALAVVAGLQDDLSQVERVGRTHSIADIVRRMHRAMHADDPAYDVVPAGKRLIAQYFFLYELSGEPEDLERYIDLEHRRAALWAFLGSDETALVARVIVRIKSYLKEHPLPAGVEARIGGNAAASLALNEEMTRGKLLNMVQVGTLIYASSSLVFGSPIAGFFVLIPLVLAVMVNFALLGFLGIWLNMSTATLSAMAVGIGADYAIYVIYRYREELATNTSLESALTRTLATSGEAVVYVAAAIAAGYATLSLSDLEFNRIVGRLVPVTMVVSAAAALTVMPAALLVFRPTFLIRRHRWRHVPAPPVTTHPRLLAGLPAKNSALRRIKDVVHRNARGVWTLLSLFRC